MSDLARHGASVAPFISLVPVLIAAVSQRARKRLLARLIEAGATDPVHAIPLDPQSRIERNWLGRLEHDGIVKLSGDRYYYDEVMAASRGGNPMGQWRLLLILLFVAIGIATAVVLLGH